MSEQRIQVVQEERRGESTERLCPKLSRQFNLSPQRMAVSLTDLSELSNRWTPPRGSKQLIKELPFPVNAGDILQLKGRYREIIKHILRIRYMR